MINNYIRNQSSRKEKQLNLPQKCQPKSGKVTSTLPRSAKSGSPSPSSSSKDSTTTLPEKSNGLRNSTETSTTTAHNVSPGPACASQWPPPSCAVWAEARFPKKSNAPMPTSTSPYPSSEQSPITTTTSSTSSMTASQKTSKSPRPTILQHVRSRNWQKGDTRRYNNG